MRARLLRVVLAVVVGVFGTGLVAGPAAAAPANVREAEWHLDALKIPQAQRITKGAGVVVAMVDTAVDASHPDLQGQVLTGTGIDVSSTNGWGSDESTVHGTAMAGLIAGKGGGNMHMLGIAPAAKILPVAVPERAESMAQGIRWAVDHGADVINISMGNVHTPRQYEIDAVRYALSKDVVVVAGTGNTPQSGVGVSSPAIIPGVVAVAGVTQTGWAWDEAGHGPQVVVAAPATNITTTAPRVYSASGFQTGDGTSQATAITSGVVALIRARYPKLNAANVINRLIATAKDNGDPGRDQKFGYGTIRPLDALTANVPTVSTNPLLAGASTTPSNSPSAQASASTGIHRIPLGVLLAIILAVFVALILLVVILAVRSGRRRRNQRVGYPAAVRAPIGYGAPPPGYPTGYPPGPGGPPGANPWPGPGGPSGAAPWPGPGRPPAINPSAAPGRPMSQPGLRLPAYFTYYDRPVKMLATAEGGMVAWQLDYTTGGWVPANNLVNEILVAVGGEIHGPMPKDRFIQFVEAARARYLAGEGPNFALYETTKALLNASDQEGRPETETEKALIVGLRRKTYAMFEAELVRRGDPAADAEAASEAAQPAGE